jgi:tetratricopeptide (TPR) repeat protein
MTLSCYAQDDARVQELLDLAESYDDDRGAPEDDANRDLAVQYYREALALIPSDPVNIKLEYHIVQLLLQMDIGTGAGARYEDAYEALGVLLDRYDHADYLAIDPPDAVYDPSILVPRAALHAGDLSLMLHQDAESARTYYERAMRAFAETQAWREQAYNNAAPPVFEEFFDETIPHEISQRRFEAANAEYEARMLAIEEGNLLPEGGMEYDLAYDAVQRFAGSFPNFDAARPELERLAKEYPGTPMAVAANDLIKSAENAAATKSEPPSRPAEDSEPPQENPPAAGAPAADTNETGGTTTVPKVQSADPIQDESGKLRESEDSRSNWFVLPIAAGALALLLFLRVWMGRTNRRR